MHRLKQHWKRLPVSLRRPLVLLIGLLLIVLSGLIGWIPGPGGMVPFLLGIAILATEFTWAERLRDRILGWLKLATIAARKRPALSLAIVLSGIAGITLFAYAFYKHTI